MLLRNLTAAQQGAEKVPLKRSHHRDYGAITKSCDAIDVAILDRWGQCVKGRDIDGMATLLTFYDIVNVIVPGLELSEWAALTYFCYQKDKYMVIFLLNHRAYINLVDGFGLTPLHTALSHRHFSILALLVQRGADVNKPSKGNLFLLHYAIETKGNYGRPLTRGRG